MADNKVKKMQDRGRIAVRAAYDLNYFRRKHGLTKEQAEQIIEEAKGGGVVATVLAHKLRKS